MKTKSKDELNLLLWGIIIVAFSLGSMFAIDLVRYSYFILLAAGFISVVYIKEAFASSYTKRKLSSSVHFVGIFGGVLMALFLGMQSPQMLFKPYLLGIGVLIFLFGYVKLRR